jgi:hypothetical protein
MNVSLPLVVANLGLLAILLGLKLATKTIAVCPLAWRYARPHAMFTTLLMSTGLTFGTISATYGYTAGIITRTQFSVLVTVVVLSAIVPTAIAQRSFSPPATDTMTHSRPNSGGRARTPQNPSPVRRPGPTDRRTRRTGRADRYRWSGRRTRRTPGSWCRRSGRQRDGPA